MALPHGVSRGPGAVPGCVVHNPLGGRHCAIAALIAMRCRFPLPGGASGWAAPQGRSGPCAGRGAAARAGVTWARRLRGVGAAPAAAALCRPLSAVRCAALTLLPVRRRRSPPAPRVCSSLPGKRGRGTAPAGLPGTRTLQEVLHWRGDAARTRAGLWLGGGAGEVENKSIHLAALV